jgi:hypothetical protein
VVTQRPAKPFTPVRFRSSPCRTFRVDERVACFRDSAHEALLRELYEAFNRRDVEAVIAALHPDVDWPNAFEGGRVRGHAEVRAYWTRQFAQIDPQVEPLRFETTEDARVAVSVHQVVRALDGSVLADREVTHVYALRDGLIVRMDVREAPG